MSEEKKSEEKLMLTVAEVAARLGVSRKLVYDMVKDGRIPSLRLPGAGPSVPGRLIRIPRAAFDAWINDPKHRRVNSNE
jgi:excisionase family DNA binding protein